MVRTFYENVRNLLVNPKRSRETTLRSLPNDVVCNKIFPNLSTKDSVRISSLTKIWENLWLDSPELDLDTDNFKNDLDFWDFLGRFFESEKGLDLKTFKLVYNVVEHKPDRFLKLIDETISRRVCHIFIENTINDREENLVKMPISLYSCMSLVNVTLNGVVFNDIPSRSISLPSLKTMHLEDVKFDGDRLMRTFISRCPVLEELVIVTCHNDSLGLVGVRSRSLKSFTLESTRGDVFEDTEDDRPSDPDVEINAPRLEHMVITDYQCEKFVVHKIGPCATVSVDVIFDGEYDDAVEANLIRDLLTGISTVEEMAISDRTLEMIGDCNELGPLPKFPKLLSLELSFIDYSLKMLPAFLGCCPNLHSLILECDPLSEEVDLTFVPPCFESSLECVELTTPSRVKGTSTEKKLASYFLMNCTVLKTLFVRKTFEDIVNEIKEIPKKSAMCEILTY